MGHRRNFEGKATGTGARLGGGLSREWLSCATEIVAAVWGPTGAPMAVESRRREVEVSTSLSASLGRAEIAVVKAAMTFASTYSVS